MYRLEVHDRPGNWILSKSQGECSNMAADLVFHLRGSFEMLLQSMAYCWTLKISCLKC